jgi:hypothetical protein
MLSMAASAPRPGSVVDLPYRWRREKYAPVTDWKLPSKALISALAGKQVIVGREPVEEITVPKAS